MAAVGADGKEATMVAAALREIPLLPSETITTIIRVVGAMAVV